MAKKQIKLSANYMDIVYGKNPDFTWSEGEDGNVVLKVVNTGLFNKIAQKFFHRPRVSYISLDVYGTAVWKALDGKNTVFDIVKHMEEEFPDESDRMLDRVVTFMRTLHVNHYIVKGD